MRKWLHRGIRGHCSTVQSRSSAVGHLKRKFRTTCSPKVCTQPLVAGFLVSSRCDLLPCALASLSVNRRFHVAAVILTKASLRGFTAGVRSGAETLQGTLAPL